MSLVGIKALNIEVQVHFANGNPGLTIVGLPDKAIGESRERIRAVLSSIGYSFPAKRITVNLAPADVLKEGSHYDLPIAIGILAGLGAVDKNKIAKYIILGELSLNGQMRKVNGILPVALSCVIEGKSLICPYENGQEARWAGAELDIIAAKNILSVLNILKGEEVAEIIAISEENITNGEDLDFQDVYGNAEAKRAMIIAASGNHNILLIGSPGSGKSMLCNRIKGILPPLDPSEMLEVSMIYSVSGLIENGNLTTSRPFRNPHHSASMPSIIGGGKTAKPGEISLAHCGVLFLDELPEYPKQILEALRQPMESGSVSISRINSKMTYPAKFQLVSAMNPCTCGFLYDKSKTCPTKTCAIKYQSKLSGPILDRIDIQIKMESQKYNLTNSKEQKGENSANIKSKVIHTRSIQKERFQKMNKNILTNSQMQGEIFNSICLSNKKLDPIINTLTEKYHFSLRSISKILKVARTIADFENNSDIKEENLLEAISYKDVVRY